MLAYIAWSSNGRTLVSGTKNRGSIPCRAASWDNFCLIDKI